MSEKENNELQELLRLASTSKRAIDLIVVSMLTRIEQRIRDTEEKAAATHRVVFGSDGSMGLMQKMAIIVFLAAGLAGSWRFFFDKATGVATAPIFGETLKEKWMKQATKRIRIYNKATGKYEYFYMLQETKEPEGE